jgi:acyl carrier protein
MGMRDELLEVIGRSRLPGPIADDTPLLRAGVLDSLAIFKVVVWIEEQTGRPLDPTSFDFATELDSVANILQLVARLRNGSAQE